MYNGGNEEMNLDYAKIKEAAKNYEKDMTKFLRDIVKFPGESCDEKAHIDRIAEEMTKLGFNKVEIDPMGNVLGYMGTCLLYTSVVQHHHMGCKSVGHMALWIGYIRAQLIGGVKELRKELTAFQLA